MINSKLLSVIIPLYNAENYIYQLLSNLNTLNTSVFEVIFVDDGSTDCTIKAIESNLSNILFDYEIYYQENQGQSVARNFGMYKSKLPYICFIDPDDLLTNSYINMLEIISSNPASDLIIGGFLSQKLSGNQIPIVPLTNHNDYEIFEGESIKLFFIDFIKKNIKIHNSAIIFKREFLYKSKLEFNESLRYGEDSVFILKSLLNTLSFLNYPSIVYCYIDRPKSLMKSVPMNNIDSFLDSLVSTMEESLPDHKLPSSRIILSNYMISSLKVIASYRDYSDYKEFITNRKLKTIRMNEVLGLRFVILLLLLKTSIRLAYYFMRIL